MKKHFQLAAIIFALVFCFSTTTFAAGTPTFIADVATDEIMVGDEVTLTISLKDNPGIASFLFDIKYDESLFYCEESDIVPEAILTNGGFMSIANPNHDGDVRIVTASARNTFENGVLFSVTFHAIASGTSDFDLEFVSATSDVNNIEVNTVSTSVTVIDDIDENSPSLPVQKPDVPDHPTASELPTVSFSDVPESHWAYTYVQNAVKQGLFSGIGNGMFGPGMNVTRGMFVTTLYSSAGSPNVELSNFTDVPADAWYAKAVAWASQQGIVSGIGNNKFGPEMPITREQIALILYNYAGGTSPGTEMFVRIGYPDGNDIHDWALTAFTWAMNKDLISGKSGNILDPLATATRAEVAVIMHNFVNLTK